jgi:type IV pilus assembly protein PilZ
MVPGVEDETLVNRRKHTRAPIELRVEYKRLNSFFADYTRNISRGGTFVATERPLPVGTEFLFKLTVPKLNKPLALRGKVHWIVTPEDAEEERVAGMGIGFVYQTEAERQAVEREVERLMIGSLGQALYDKLMAGRNKDE